MTTIPDTAPSPRRDGSALVSLVAAGLVLTGCGVWRDLFGWPRTNDTNDTNAGWLAMVPNGGSHTLTFSDPAGSVTWRVEIVVDDADLLYWFVSDEEEAVAAVDAVILPWGADRFATDDGFDDVEAEIGPALVAAWGGGGTAGEVVIGTTLIVIDCQVEGGDNAERGGR